MFPAVRKLRLFLALVLLSFLSEARTNLMAENIQTLDSAPLRIDLPAAIQIGTTNYFALKAVKNRELAARQLITERWRRYLPRVGLQYDQSRAVNAGAADNFNYDIRLTVQQVIYDGGKRSMDLDLAKIDEILARQDYKITYNKVRLDIQKAYFNVLAAQGKSILNQKSLERARIQLHDAKRENELGFSTRAQVLSVAARLRQIELSLSRSQNEHRQAIHDLQQLLNLEYDTNIVVVGSIFDDFFLFPPASDLHALVSRARAERPDLLRSQTNIYKLKKERERAEDAWIPQFSIGGYVGRNGPQLPVKKDEWGLNVALSFPLGSTTTNTQTSLDTNPSNTQRDAKNSSQIQFFDDLGYDRRLLEAKVALGQGISDHRTLYNKIAIDIAKANDRLKEAWEAIRIGNGRVYFQFENLRLQHASATVGQSRRADIVFQETELVSAQQDLNDAIANYMVAAYELEDTAGLEPGSLRFFVTTPKRGNTLLPYLLTSDFDSLQRRIRENTKKPDTDPMWQIDQLEPVPEPDTKKKK